MSAPVAGRVPRGADDEAAVGEDRQFVTALSRGLQILSCFGTTHPELGTSQIAAMTGLPQPTVWRLCHTMTRLGYLVPVLGDKLRPGIPVLRLGRALLASISLSQRAYAPMKRLADAFGSASGLAAHDDGRMVFVQRTLSEAQLVMNLRVGSRLPILTSAVGWGYLAGMPAGEREALIARRAPAEPRWASVEPRLRAALREAEGTGFILNVGAFHEGYNTVAAPIPGPDGRPAFALSCAGSAVTHTPAFLRAEIAPRLLAVADELARALAATAGPARSSRIAAPA